MLDEASLELFESQSHLLDPDSLAALQKQRQLREWQAGGSVGNEGTLADSLERQDSAGSGNKPVEVRCAGTGQGRAGSHPRIGRCMGWRGAPRRTRHPPPSPARPPSCSTAKRQLKTALTERDAQVTRVNELTQQLQDKKRQLFTAIQVGGCMGRAGSWVAAAWGRLRMVQRNPLPAHLPTFLPARRRSVRGCASRTASWRTSAASSRSTCSASCAAR